MESSWSSRWIPAGHATIKEMLAIRKNGNLIESNLTIGTLENAILGMLSGPAWDWVRIWSMAPIFFLTALVGDDNSAAAAVLFPFLEPPVTNWSTSTCKSLLEASSSTKTSERSGFLRLHKVCRCISEGLPKDASQPEWGEWCGCFPSYRNVINNLSSDDFI